MRASTCAPLPLTALAYLSEIEWLQGNLRQASRMYEQALGLAEKYGGQPSIALCFVHWGRASLLYEWTELDKARHALQESIRIGELWKHPRFLVRPYGLSALVMLAGGQLGEASAMIRRAEQITRDAHPTPPTLGSLALHQILLWMAQNDFQAITKWEHRHDSEWLSQIGREREHLVIVLVRACIARYHRMRDDFALKQARALIEPA
ncbi:MAG: tetratricopeptide repeat protein, partial [Alphaproteobacteria bacterium]|nr:tetratricopeptide repeat protein [Alphaproteobacteria bacterium]